MNPPRILSLDGGGSKGIYTLGVLRKIEQESGKAITELFDAIYGTSTGAIITAFLALGKSVEEIRQIYLTGVPEIMKGATANSRSIKLETFAETYLGDISYEDFMIDVGIIASRVDLKRPMIFKSNVKSAHNSINSFIPFFGVSVKDAVTASCSAVPFFKKKTVETKNYEKATLIDGGFCANNPSLFSLIDAVNRFGQEQEVVLINVGVGSYPTKPYPLSPLLKIAKLISSITSQKLKEDFQDYLLTTPLMMEMTGMTHEFIINKLIPNSYYKRISLSFSSQEYATNFIDPSIKTMDKLYMLGINSWGKLGDCKDIDSVLSKIAI
jgi:predicted acylesterase/phospholipase RssA